MICFKDQSKKKRTEENERKKLWENKFRRQHVSSFTVITEDEDW